MFDYDQDKVDECTLALLHLVYADKPDKDGSVRVWKSFDWDTMNRLHEKELISDPVNKNKSVWLTPEGARQAEQLFERFFQNGES